MSFSEKCSLILCLVLFIFIGPVLILSFLPFQTDPGILLRKSIMTATRSAIRDLIKANRLMEEYKEMMRGTKDEGLDPSSLIIFDNGYFTIISGAGKSFMPSVMTRHLVTTLEDFRCPEAHQIPIMPIPDFESFHLTRHSLFWPMMWTVVRFF